MRIAAIIALGLIAAAAALCVWAFNVSDGPGSADERLGGAYIFAIAGVFGIGGLLAGLVAIVMGVFG